MSSRALTSDMIKEIWLHNHERPDVTNLGIPSPVNQRGQVQEVYLTRAMIHTIITLGFVWLMRIDEILSLRVQDIEARHDGGLEITLSTRKMNFFEGKRLINFPFKLVLYKASLFQV